MGGGETIIFTLGYSALSYKAELIIPRLKELAEQYDAVIIDIRSKPFGLVNMPDLKRALGDRYQWHRKLGHPQWKELKTYSLNHPNVILMCAEKNVDNCHRKDVAIKMKEWRGQGEKIKHLNSSRFRQLSLLPR